jgi:hypothetical protein
MAITRGKSPMSEVTGPRAAGSPVTAEGRAASVMEFLGIAATNTVAAEAIMIAIRAAEADAAARERCKGRGLFRTGDFRLASGAASRWKIDCEALTPADWDSLALMLRDRLGPFGAVEGVPSGGLRLAEAMAAYATAGPLLVVDDVWTTGGSWERWRAGREAVGAAVFARGPVPPHITALFYMDCAAIRARGAAP